MTNYAYNQYKIRIVQGLKNGYSWVIEAWLKIIAHTILNHSSHYSKLM